MGMWGRELVLGHLKMNSGRYQEINSYDRKTSYFLTIQSNSHFSKFTTQCQFPTNGLPSPHHIALSPTTPMHPHTFTGAYMSWMIAASEGDAWMGLKCPRDEKAPFGSAGGGIRVKMR